MVHTRNPRLKDVAQEAGISIATASRAMSGSPGVSAQLAQRVRQIAADLGYVANVHARSLAGSPSSVVGLVVHEIGDPYFSEIASGVLSVASTRGLTVQICHSGRDPEAELAQVRTLIANQVGAIIVAGSGFVDPAKEAGVVQSLKRYQEGGGRVAVIGRHSLRADTVQPDNREGGTTIAEHLLGLGHRRIGVVSGSRQLTTVADRLVGIDGALATAGLSLDATPLVEAPFTREGGKQAITELLTVAPDVTAVIGMNDDMAIGVLSVLRSRGVMVPEQISVTGFDDVAVAGDLAPGLTTIRLPMSEMGRQALKLALAPPATRRRSRRAAHELVVRGSTAPPRADSVLRPPA
ncbi:LacI family DNA-binding transcriptional regulator [Ornithinimicrobium pratense]|uniref:LacI family transcriptional regulator n=1 Tax=Ornithinimicrobium pratense TaxID=2593973 RepID=A0A5J6V7Y9_9MICO|nr:LacI family DNA-binding transcriptional regulator [Ornithinimicrobium pratense]QFG69251.1 LacI family transcriptional regulator [Ornithinimicrobium pratense]